MQAGVQGEDEADDDDDDTLVCKESSVQGPTGGEEAVRDGDPDLLTAQPRAWRHPPGGKGGGAMLISGRGYAKDGRGVLRMGAAMLIRKAWLC